jgi:hypothetical protein
MLGQDEWEAVSANYVIQEIAAAMSFAAVLGSTIRRTYARPTAAWAPAAAGASSSAFASGGRLPEARPSSAPILRFAIHETFEGNLSVLKGLVFREVAVEDSRTTDAA